MATIRLAINKEVVVTKDGSYIEPRSEKGILSLPKDKASNCLNKAIEEGLKKLKEPGVNAAWVRFFTGEYVDTPLSEIKYSLLEKEIELLKKGTWVINSKQTFGAWKRVSRHYYLCAVDYETAQKENMYNIGWPIWFPNRKAALEFLYNDGDGGVKVNI